MQLNQYDSTYSKKKTFGNFAPRIHMKNGGKKSQRKFAQHLHRFDQGYLDKQDSSFLQNISLPTVAPPHFAGVPLSRRPPPNRPPPVFCLVTREGRKVIGPRLKLCYFQFQPARPSHDVGPTLLGLAPENSILLGT